MASGVRNGLFAAASFVALACAGPASAETLADAIALAFQTNPTLQQQRANLRFVEEGYVQARAGYRPTVSGVATFSYNRTGQGRTQTTTGVNIPIPGSDSRGLSGGVQLSQSLYSGGRISAGVTAAEADILAERETLRQTEADVLQQAITAYVDVRRDLQSLAIRKENVAVLKRQVDETRIRFDVGEVTRTDVAQSEAQLASAQALLATAQAQLALSRASYAAVVGQSPGDLAQEPQLKLPPTIDEAFDTAMIYNPNIRSADYSRQGAGARLAAAKAERRPSVSLSSTLGYSTNQPTAAGGRFNGNGFENDDFRLGSSTSITVRQPLFAGGLIDSGIRQSVERENFFIIQTEGARRTTTQAVAQSWNQLLSSRANIAANAEQVRAARVAFEGAQAEQAVGLRTTLEVLTAQQVLRDAELSLVNARHDEYVASAAVLNATGQLAADNLVAGASRRTRRPRVPPVEAGARLHPHRRGDQGSRRHRCSRYQTPSGPAGRAAGHRPAGACGQRLTAAEPLSTC